MQKKRLDLMVHEQHPEWSRRQIQDWIVEGRVSVDGKIVQKPGQQISPEIQHVLLQADAPRFVSRAGYKLEKALDHFDINVTNLVALDAGLSTGGFTDCMLQRGIKKVYGIDVGTAQVHPKIKADSRVIVRENTNLRYLEGIVESIDIITLDLSFISVLKVMDVVAALLNIGGILIVLIKPQFESSREALDKHGVVRSASIHNFVVKKVIEGITEYGFACHGYIQSPILGGDGNTEFLACFHKVR